MLDIAELAARQLRDYDARNPGSIFADPLPLDLEAAYSIQDEVARLRAQRGDQLIGYKVGCTSPGIQQQLSIHHPVFGRLFGNDSWESGIVFTPTQFSNPAIEGELAVRLTRDIVADMDDDDVFNALDSIFSVVEMHNLVFRRGRPSAEELIANNCVHAGFVFPSTLLPPVRDDTNPLQILIDGDIVATVPGEHLMATITESLRWLARQPRPLGLSPLAGQTILCGSVAPVFPITPGTCVSVNSQNFGSVRCTIG